MNDANPAEFDPDLIRQLIHDPDFIRVSAYADKPNLFRILGRTFTETWHSMLLAWLLNPKGSHDLGFRPLAWFCGAMAVQTKEKVGRAGRRWAHLALFLDEKCDPMVTPNEYGDGEYTYEKKERVDVRITGLALDASLYEDKAMLAGHLGTLIVEQKVMHSLTWAQLDVYKDYEENSKADDAWFLGGVVAPADAIQKIQEKLAIDDYWSAIDYQQLHDEVLQPILRHPDLSQRSRLIVEDYILALTSDTGGKALVISKEQRDLAINLRNRHAKAFAMLASALQNDEDPLPTILTEPSSKSNTPLVLTINGEEVAGETSNEFILQVLKRLSNLGLLSKIPLPMQTSAKRHFIAETATHPNGNAFVNPYLYPAANFWIEMNRSRESTFALAQRLVKECGATLDHEAPTSPAGGELKGTGVVNLVKSPPLSSP